MIRPPKKRNEGTSLGTRKSPRKRPRIDYKKLNNGEDTLYIWVSALDFPKSQRKRKKKSGASGNAKKKIKTLIPVKAKKIPKVSDSPKFPYPASKLDPSTLDSPPPLSSVKSRPVGIKPPFGIKPLVGIKPPDGIKTLVGIKPTNGIKHVVGIKAPVVIKPVVELKSSNGIKRKVKHVTGKKPSKRKKLFPGIKRSSVWKKKAASKEIRAPQCKEIQEPESKANTAPQPRSTEIKVPEPKPKENKVPEPKPKENKVPEPKPKENKEPLLVDEATPQNNKERLRKTSACAASCKDAELIRSEKVRKLERMLAAGKPPAPGVPRLPWQISISRKREEAEKRKGSVMKEITVNRRRCQVEGGDGSDITRELIKQKLREFERTMDEKTLSEVCAAVMLQAPGPEQDGNKKKITTRLMEVLDEAQMGSPSLDYLSKQFDMVFTGLSQLGLKTMSAIQGAVLYSVYRDNEELVETSEALLRAKWVLAWARKLAVNAPLGTRRHGAGCYCVEIMGKEFFKPGFCLCARRESFEFSRKYQDLKRKQQGNINAKKSMCFNLKHSI